MAIIYMYIVRFFDYISVRFVVKVFELYCRMTGFADNICVRLVDEMRESYSQVNLVGLYYSPFHKTLPKFGL